MESKPYPISSDDEHNDELAAELGALRGGMLTQVPAAPERFTVLPCVDRPALSIFDTASGRETIVPLYAAHAVVAALNELFSD